MIFERKKFSIENCTKCYPNNRGTLHTIFGKKIFKKGGGGLRLASIVLYFHHQLSKHLYPKNMYTSNVYKSYTFLTPVGDRGSIPGRVRPKSLKQVLIAECSVTGVSVMSSQR